MGVKGLTDFLQKTCSHVIQKLPQHYEALSGKTIAIDGTLFTRRFIHSPLPHISEHSRHIHGWYNLVATLRQHNITVICVFDGKSRNAAKAFEVERRRIRQEKIVQRAAYEQERLESYEELLKGLDVVDKLEPSELKRALKTIKGVRKTPTSDVTTRLSLAYATTHVVSTLDSDGARLLGSDPAMDEELAHLADLVEASSIGDSASSIPTEDEHPPQDLSVSISTGQEPLPTEDDFRRHDTTPVNLDTTLRTDPTDVDPSTTVSAEVDEEILLEMEELLSDYADCTSESLFIFIIDRMRSLFTRFNRRAQAQEAPSKATIQPPKPEAESAAEPVTVEDVIRDQDISKQQAVLNQKEGQWWAGIDPDTYNKEESRALLHEIKAESETIASSYAFSAVVPKWEYFAESKELLQAMGIPCVTAADGYEGEAVAASIVHNGLAHYVASEDLDVVMYEAPLIRYLDNHKQMMIISGARDGLKLTRESYVDFAILAGTDFCPTIKNVGIVRAFKFVKEYGTIEMFVQSLQQKQTTYTLPMAWEDYLTQVNDARKVFNTLPPPPTIPPAQWNQEKVVNILSTHKLSWAVQDDPDWDGSDMLRGNYFGDNPTIN